MNYNEIIKEKIELLAEKVDSECSLPYVNIEKIWGGYHTRRLGIVHPTNDAAMFVSSVFSARYEKYYDMANEVLEALIDLQDTDEKSETYGLWSYYKEEDLKDMLAPDYNWADFIAKYLLESLYRNPENIKNKDKLKKAIERAVLCSIKRNVSPDYTNISLMSSVTIIAAGEILSNNEFFEKGKARLKKALQYNEYCGNLSEYNSVAYTPLAIMECSRMLEFFKDSECRHAAEVIRGMAWKTLAEHYHSGIKQLAPPQARAYKDLDDGELENFIYIATGGKYGSFDKLTQIVTVPLLMLKNLDCPEKYLKLFEPKNDFFIDETYYRRNSIRSKNEDTVIVRNVDSPDLRARTYIDADYCMGAFEASDLWAQRRTSMIIWGKENYLRLRCIDGDHDYCSAMAYTAQYKNKMLTNIGFVTDRGSFHYILDKVKDGIVESDLLCFEFEPGGDIKNIKVERTGNKFKYISEDITIYLNIKEWVFDGQPGNIEFDEEKKTVRLLCFRGRNKIDTKKLKNTYGVFTLSVNEKMPEPEVKKCDELISVCDKLEVISNIIPENFDSAMERQKTKIGSDA